MKMMSNKVLFGVFLCLILSGCSEPIDSRMSIEKPGETGTANYADRVQPELQQRFEVKRIGVIEDKIAYEQRRGIYLIKDTKTGIEYFGISGIGVTETGSHQSGKVTVSDER